MRRNVMFFIRVRESARARAIIIYITVSYRYCRARLSIRRITHIAPLHEFTSRDVSPKREDLVIVDYTGGSWGCVTRERVRSERRRTARGLDVVVTTRTYQKEHKNTQRLSLVRSSAQPPPFYLLFPHQLSPFFLSPLDICSLSLSKKKKNSNNHVSVCSQRIHRHAR